MQELFGKLTALDPHASESLRVISYFDALNEASTNSESIVRAAAILAGVTAGASFEGRTIRIGIDGKPDLHDPAEIRLTVPLSDGGEVWLERDGSPYANDQLILERLALSLGIALGRQKGAGFHALEISIDREKTLDERAKATGLLRLPPGSPVTIAAMPATSADPHQGPSAITVTAEGMLRVALLTRQTTAPPGRVGVACAKNPSALPEAWLNARLMLRLSDDTSPLQHADSFGALVPFLRRATVTDYRHPDVEAFRRLSKQDLKILDSLVTSNSVRAAALQMNMHHSSMQAHHRDLAGLLGYDPRSPQGHIRYTVARALYKLGPSSEPLS